MTLDYSKMTKSLFLGVLVFVSFTMMVSLATMNVGTFWFAQNNGKFFPIKPYNNLQFRGGPRRQIQQQQIPQQFSNGRVDPVQAKVRPAGSRLPSSWWTDFQVWNKMMRYLHNCKHILKSSALYHFNHKSPFSLQDLFCKEKCIISLTKCVFCAVNFLFSFSLKVKVTYFYSLT